MNEERVEVTQWSDKVEKRNGKGRRKVGGKRRNEGKRKGEVVNRNGGGWNEGKER